ncbi:MAG: transposase [Deltaproteobacteria bacterium]|nr:transposase [Deltaproteobacteria bacterium]
MRQKTFAECSFEHYRKPTRRDLFLAARDFTQKKACRNRPLSDAERSKNKTKSRVRAKVEHPFLVFKRIFGFCKVRYRGLMKNANRLFVACGLTNLYMARKRLLCAT